MTDLISTPPSPASPAGSKVAIGAWWPDIEVAKVRAGVNLGDTTIAHDRLVEAIAFAAIEVTGELAEWQAAQIEAGHASLAAVAPERTLTIDGQEGPALVVLFRRAVTMLAAAELADRNRDLTTARDGADRGEARADMADDFRRSATRAIRAIIGETGTMVDLV